MRAVSWRPTTAAGPLADGVGAEKTRHLGDDHVLLDGRGLHIDVCVPEVDVRVRVRRPHRPAGRLRPNGSENLCGKKKERKEPPPPWFSISMVWSWVLSPESDGPTDRQVSYIRTAPSDPAKG